MHRGFPDWTTSLHHTFLQAETLRGNTPGIGELVAPDFFWKNVPLAHRSLTVPGKTTPFALLLQIQHEKRFCSSPDTSIANSAGRPYPTKMKILWKYLKPQKWLIVVALVMAGISQLLNLVDPLIFGKIIDDYALNPLHLAEEALVAGVLFWLGIAIGIALLSRLAKAFQDYFTRLAVEKFGMQIFNDGLKQTLRLSYNEFEEQRSGETLSVLQKVRTDTQAFINTTINVLFSSIIGLGFLIGYSVTKNWMLLPVFVVGILVLGSLTGLLSKKIKTTQREINRETNTMSGVITESLRNIELVKSLGLTYPEIRRLRDQNLKIFNLEMIKVKKVRTLTFLQGTTSAS